MTRPALDTSRDASASAGEDHTKGSSASPATPANTRSLRQAPPQRQFYQPPASTPRGSAKNMTTTTVTAAAGASNATGTVASGPGTGNPSSTGMGGGPVSQHPHQQQQQQQQQQNVNTQMAAGQSWTPPNSTPLQYSATATFGPVPLPVMTPGSNPGAYSNQRQVVPQQQRQIKCGTGHPGPSPMKRIVMGLKSGISEEVEYALNNLVRISFEAEDSLNADDHPGMTESLVQVLSTLQIFTRANQLLTIETPSSRKKLDRVLEAALILRNMSIQVDNARHMASLVECRSALVKGITLPSRGGLVELKHYCLDIVESLSPWLILQENLDLYEGLKAGLTSDDRGVLIASLRGLTRLVQRDETNKLKDVNVTVIKRIQDLLLLEDEELLLACLDFLYQYTSVEENIAKLMVEHEGGRGGLEFLKQLRRLLHHQAQEFCSEYHLRARRKESPPPGIPMLPQEIVTELLGFPEPERATKWMRCCFEEDPDADITQIALWQAYQARFSEYVPQGRPLLAAADFIKNVSISFVNASAMVIPQPPPQPQKFIIKGIKPRHTPLSPRGIEYLACKWMVKVPPPPAPPAPAGNGIPQPPPPPPPQGRPQRQRCPAQLGSPNDLFSHILDVHIKPPPPGTTPKPLVCRWADCDRYSPHGDSDRRKVISHIRTHMPDIIPPPPPPANKDPSSSSTTSSSRIGTSLGTSNVRTGPSLDHSDLFYNKVLIRAQRTAVDERGDAAGVALTAVLVLRNVARAGHAKEVLGGLEEGIHEVAAVNQALAPYIYDMLKVKYEEEGEV